MGESAKIDRSDLESSKPDIPSIMADIRRKIAADLATSKDQTKPFPSYKADTNGTSARKAGELLHSEELRYLNQNYSYSSRLSLDSISSHRPGFIGKFIVKVKRKFLSVLWENLLKDYLASEKEYNASLVRFLNDVSKYVDSRDASNFWELIRKIDYDVNRATERIERHSDEIGATLRTNERNLRDSLEKELRTFQRYITELQGQSAKHDQSLRTLESVTSGLEGIVARLKSPTSTTGETKVTVPDYSYVLLENRFRGSQEEIAERLSIYPKYFLGTKLPVLEIGSGRGELQVLFKNSSVPSYGVDSDEGMITEAKERGLDVRLEDGIAHLRNVADGSLGGVIAIQVVEHLPRTVLDELMTLCARKVAKGGKIIFETINPRSMLALSSNYFRDPTHVFPQHPDTLSHSMSLAGMKIVEVKYLSPVPQEVSLREISQEEYMTPRWVELIDRFNSNIRALNDLLFGYQDYCVIGEV